MKPLRLNAYPGCFRAFVLTYWYYGEWAFLMPEGKSRWSVMLACRIPWLKFPGMVYQIPLADPERWSPVMVANTPQNFLKLQKTKPLVLVASMMG